MHGTFYLDPTTIDYTGSPSLECLPLGLERFIRVSCIYEGEGPFSCQKESLRLDLTDLPFSVNPQDRPTIKDGLAKTVLDYYQAIANRGLLGISSEDTFRDMTVLFFTA